MKKYTFLLLILVTSYLFPVSAFAQSVLGLSAIPPRLEITVKPGEAISKEIKVRNESKTERVITTTSKDFIVTDDSGTPIQIEDLEESANRWAASSWVHISPSNYRLKPGETKSLVVTIIAPDDALPGGHYTMVLHSPNNESVLNSTGSFIQTNVGSLLYITVPGDIHESAKVSRFSVPPFSEYGPIDLHATVVNYSDIHITPVGSIVITNWFGGKTASLALDTTNIFPNTTRQFNNTLNKKWLFGRYAATFTAGYGTTGQALLATVFFWVLPWKLIILLLAAIGLIIAIYLLIKKNKTNSSNDQVIELEKELDQLKKKYKDRNSE